MVLLRLKAVSKRNEAGRDSVSRNGPRGYAKSVAPTAEIVGFEGGETDPPRRYRVSRVAEGSFELNTGHGEVVRRRASEISVFKCIDRAATAGGAS